MPQCGPDLALFTCRVAAPSVTPVLEMLSGAPFTLAGVLLTVASQYLESRGQGIGSSRSDWLYSKNLAQNKTQLKMCLTFLGFGFWV